MDGTQPFPHHWTRRDILRGSLAVGATAAGVPLLGACSGQNPNAAGGGDMPRNETLFVNGLQWGPPTNFNPLNPDPDFPAGGQNPHLYETLFSFNMLTGGLDPMLGEKQTIEGTTGTVTLHSGTSWQDGKPLTADDVVYSFELAKRVTAVSYATFWEYVQEVGKVDDRTVKFALKAASPNPLMLRQYLTTVRILPKHVWEALEKSGDITTLENLKPVGSGPYKLKDHSVQSVTLERHDGYWGKDALGAPAPRYIVHPVFKSNDDGNLAFQRGEVDFSQQFLPRIWELWEKRNLPVGTWFKQRPYHMPGNIPLLHINIGKKPWNDPRLRLALAHAINYDQVATTAMSQYSVPAMASLILPDGPEKEYFDETKAKAAWSYNPDRARQILEGQLGAKKGSDGIYVLPGNVRLGPFEVITPHGWTDWMSALEVVSQNAKAVGIDIVTKFPEQPQVQSAIQTGDFTLAMWSFGGVSPASPWLRLRDALDNTGVPAVGKNAFWNYVRYQNPAVPGLLARAAAAPTNEARKPLVQQLDDMYRQSAHVIPLMYRPLDFYQFHESVWEGFPTSEDPKAPPMHNHGAMAVLRQIKAKKQ